MKPLIVIVGETASGKSHLALQMAQLFGGELICADSWTVRREVNIGTAKPLAAEQALVPHHLLDVAGPDEDFTAAVFKDLALQAIDDISDRQRTPIMVGGSGLYIDSVLYDYQFLEAGDRGQRAELNNVSLEELLNRIEAANIELGDVDSRNKRRLIRLLETDGARPARSGLRANTLVIGLHCDRAYLQARVTERTQAMLDAGLEQEVAGLIERYGWDCEALKGIGYSQWQEYFLGTQSLQTTAERITAATLGLAKRQRTWFKRNKSIHWFNTPVNEAVVAQIITDFLHT